MNLIDGFSINVIYISSLVILYKHLALTFDMSDVIIITI